MWSVCVCVWGGVGFSRCSVALYNGPHMPLQLDKRIAKKYLLFHTQRNPQMIVSYHNLYTYNWKLLV